MNPKFLDIELVRNFWPEKSGKPTLDVLFQQMNKLVEHYGQEVEDIQGRRDVLFLGPTFADLPDEVLPPPKVRSTFQLGTPRLHRPIPTSVMPVLNAVCSYTGVMPDAITVNRYRDFDFLRYHADPPTILGPTMDNMVISTLSLGGDRRFGMRKIGHAGEAYGTYLHAGDLFIMRGKTQFHYEHAVFPEPRPEPTRISLTFFSYSTEPWTVREKYLYSVVLASVRHQRDATLLHRGTRASCARKIQGLEMAPGRAAFLVGPELLPPIAVKFGPKIPQKERKSITKMFEKMRVID